MFVGRTFGSDDMCGSPSQMCAPFFPGIFFCVYIESPNPKKPRRPHTKGSNPHQLKTPASKTQSKPPTPNYYRWAKIRKKLLRITQGKNIATCVHVQALVCTWEVSALEIVFPFLFVCTVVQNIRIFVIIVDFSLKLSTLSLVQLKRS